MVAILHHLGVGIIKLVILAVIHLVVLLVVCIYVFYWSLASIPCPNHEAVGIQTQAVDIPDLDSCASPRYIFKLPYVEDECQ